MPNNNTYEEVNDLSQQEGIYSPSDGAVLNQGIVCLAWDVEQKFLAKILENL